MLYFLLDFQFRTLSLKLKQKHRYVQFSLTGKYDIKFIQDQMCSLIKVFLSNDRAGNLRNQKWINTSSLIHWIPDKVS